MFIGGAGCFIREQSFRLGSTIATKPVVTNSTYAMAFAQLYRDRAGYENGFDERT
jgi:hypothetical protein